MPHTDWMYSRPPAWRSFFRRLLMCCFREPSVQSGVSWLIRSRITDLASTWPGFCNSRRQMAYSVRVSFTGYPLTATWWAVGSKVKSPQVSKAGVGAWAFRSWAVMRASSSGRAKGLLT